MLKTSFNQKCGIAKHRKECVLDATRCTGVLCLHMSKRKRSTDHSIARLKTRANLSEKKADKSVNEAFLHGKRATDYDGKARKYLNEKIRGDAYGLVYRGMCYVFSTHTGKCLTVLKLPSWWATEEWKRRRKQINYTKQKP